MDAEPRDVADLGVRLWVVCPVYQDAESFAWIRNEVLEHVSRTPELQHLSPVFVAIDDTAGLDSDLAALSRRAADVRLIVCPYNLGHQRAIVFGLRQLAVEMNDRDLVVTMDSDGQDRPRDVPLLLREVLGGGAASPSIVLARRTHRTEPFSFRIPYFFYKIFFRALTGTVVRTGNFAATSAMWLKRYIVHPYFDLCYSSTLLNLGLSTRFVGCPRDQRHSGRSRMGFIRLVNHGLRMLMPFLDRITVRLILLIVGTTAAGLAVLLATAYLHFGHGWAIPSWAFLGFLMLTLLAVGSLINLLTLYALLSHSPIFILRRVDAVEPARIPSR